MPLSPVPRRAATALEGIVRPFAAPGKGAARSRVYFNGPNTRAPGDVVDTEGSDVPSLKWSATCRPETTTLATLSVVLKEENEFAEVTRETSTVRIFDPDDSSVFVDSERVDAVEFKTATGKKTRYIYSNPVD